MSIVRYVNKKTGRVALYESTSHYDPETKQSRPIWKYLGTEDPETGELIPSSGRHGRKKESEGNTSSSKKKKRKRLPIYWKRKKSTGGRYGSSILNFTALLYQNKALQHFLRVTKFSLVFSQDSMLE